MLGSEGSGLEAARKGMQGGVRASVGLGGRMRGHVEAQEASQYRLKLGADFREARKMPQHFVGRQLKVNIVKSAHAPNENVGLGQLPTSPASRPRWGTFRESPLGGTAASPSDEAGSGLASTESIQPPCL